MIKPINGHLLIEPLKHKSFVSSDKETYEEVGVVIETGTPELGHGLIKIPAGIDIGLAGDWLKQYSQVEVKRGDKVFFDSWLAAKYPKPNAISNDDFFWLVKFEDIRAIDTNEDEIPK